MFEIDPASVVGSGTSILYLKAGAFLDFETNPVLDITVNVDDSDPVTSPDDTADLSISITDVNEALQPIIIDHTCTDLTQIPLSAIEQAKETLHIEYGHTSHGFQITAGMTDLVEFINNGGLGLDYPEDTFAFNDGGTDGALNLPMRSVFWDMGVYDLGRPDRYAWEAVTREYLDAHPEVNVIMWAWCGQANTSIENIDIYLNLMEGLIADYPDVHFVFMTGHLQGQGTDLGPLYQANEHIRAHCRENNRILYDFADIESYDPDGLVNYMPLLANENCDYDSDGDGIRESNWAIDWQNSHTEGIDWYECPSFTTGIPTHTQSLNCNLKAYAAWWLWATLAGWNQNNTAPILAANTGATVTEGGTGIIGNTQLQATDVDNTPAELQFILTAAPTNGLLKLDGTTLSISDTFTQADIDNDLLTYDHDSGETVSDSFEFTVSDGSGGSIGNTTFSIIMTPVNDDPTLAANAGAAVPEGGTGIIDNTKLQVIDVDNLPSELQFTLTAISVNGLLKLDGTTLFISDTFTQADIDNNLLTYEHDGSQTVSDSFQFTVSDGSGGSIGNTTFNITIANINEPPTVSLINTITALPENIDTTNPIKVADIVITDEGLGTNVLSLSGADASLFHINGTELFLNAGVTLERKVDLEVYLNDPSCAAYWQFEEGALGYDSVGTNNNNLYVVGAQANTSDFIEGGTSAEFSGTADRLVCSDNGLDSGFPMKSDGINKDITTIQWIKFTELGPTINEFWGKYKYRNVVYRLSAYADGRIRISSGYEGEFANQE
ncbi:MAG: cadherin-like domain-containing protein, partial [Planctomycetota bacterium]